MVVYLCMNQKEIILIWRAILVVASIGILSWVFFQNLVPSGEIVLTHKKDSASSLISNLHPKQRVFSTQREPDVQRFFIDPVYFDAKVPREFDTVSVEIIWQNDLHPIMEIGSRKVRGAWGFVVKPLENKIIDSVIFDSNLSELSLEKSWHCGYNGEVLFCQRKEPYKNLSEFFASPPEQKVISYNYNLPNEIAHDSMNVYSDISEYDYLIASYSLPEDLGDGWKKRKVVFGWNDFALYINEISFMISAPDLDKIGGQIGINGISIILKRDPLDWDGFIQYSKNQLRRLKKK